MVEYGVEALGHLCEKTRQILLTIVRSQLDEVVQSLLLDIGQLVACNNA